MSEKLLDVGSFGGFFGHLTCHQATFLHYLVEFNLLFLIWIVAPSFLGCWTLFPLALIICFQQDDHPILLDAITHVEINISPFQMAFQNT